jgi:GT2 family glycosyltransferase
VKKCLDGADAIAIPEVSFGSGFWSECKVIERKCYFEQRFIDWSIQACRFFRKSVYDSVGGWDESVGCFDDWDITAKLQNSGFIISQSNRRIFHNEGYLTLKRIILKKYNMGKSANLSKYLLSSHKSISAISSQLTPFRIVNLLKRLPRVNKKILVIAGIVFLKVIEGMAFSIGLSMSKLSKRKYDYSYD